MLRLSNCNIMAPLESEVDSVLPGAFPSAPHSGAMWKERQALPPLCRWSKMLGNATAFATG